MRALDLFAGTGWGVACQRLGIEEFGVEIMPEACATREANGMTTIYNDVWDGLSGEESYPVYDLLISSPPCQTFSTAGKGAGREALDDVLGLIAEEAYKLPGEGLKTIATERGLDDRTALVLTPLAHVWRDRPRYVAWEQVPTVLPVWEACASHMREWGYSVDTGVLHAEQYGVPQTRKRAILVASLEGVAKLPAPSHSKYYAREPERLDEGVLPWVSMAKALGWVDDTKTLTHGVQPNSAKRRMYQPSATIAFGNDSNSTGFVDTKNSDFLAIRKAKRESAFKSISPLEAQLLQSYPTSFVWCGTKTKQFLQIGNAVPPVLAEAILATLVTK